MCDLKSFHLFPLHEALGSFNRSTGGNWGGGGGGGGGGLRCTVCLNARFTNHSNHLTVRLLMFRTDNVGTYLFFFKDWF